MAILKIARMGHPVLRAVAEPVDDPKAPEIVRLVSDMVETMIDAPGVGLAAPQVHIPLRLVVFHVPEGRASEEEGDGPVPLTVLINPTIEPQGEETVLGWEGCLSLPGMMGEVPRWTSIRYRGVGLDGKQIDRIAGGFHARVVQHECDHLDGILYPARIEEFSRFGFTEELQKQAETCAEDNEGEGVDEDANASDS